jgi:hypothetical protein
MKLKITAGNVKCEVELFEDWAPETVRAILAAPNKKHSK